MYIPGLDAGRRERHKACGICPGDVGFLTPEGEFNSLFNILSEDEPANEGIHLPDNFSPLSVSIRTIQQAFGRGQSFYPRGEVEVVNNPRDG